MNNKCPRVVNMMRHDRLFFNIKDKRHVINLDCLTERLRKTHTLKKSVFDDFGFVFFKKIPACRRCLDRERGKIRNGKTTLLKGVRFAETFGETVEIDD